MSMSKLKATLLIIGLFWSVVGFAMGCLYLVMWALSYLSEYIGKDATVILGVVLLISFVMGICIYGGMSEEDGTI